MTGAELDGAISEAARRLNPLLMRDTLPHPLAVKSYWLGLLNAVGPLEFDDIGLSVFSQNNEDGILLYLFARIGFRTRTCVEFGCNFDNSTVGIPEGNSINLIVHFAFHGLIVDLEPSNIQGLRYFFARSLTTRHFHQARDTKRRYSTDDYYSPVLRAEQARPDNVDDIVSSAGFVGEVDLLAIDIDGNDINVFRAITALSARVLVIEVNSRLPFEERIFAGPEPDLGLDDATTEFRHSWGASLALIVAAAEQAGFVFVGMNSTLINAFFVRQDAFEGSGLEPAGVSDFSGHRLRPPESMPTPGVP